MKRQTRPPLNRESPEAHRGPGCWLPPAVLDELNVGVAQFAQALLQVLAEAAQCLTSMAGKKLTMGACMILSQAYIL